MTDGNPAEAISYDKPVPRDAKSPAKTALIQTQNRRREYLQRHPSYFESLDHELAGEYLSIHCLRSGVDAFDRPCAL